MMWRLWQIADSSFPAGGFAHSGGLESAFQLGEVQGEPGFRRFVDEALWQAGSGGLPLVTAAHEGSETLSSLDQLCNVFLSNPVANRASRVQGRAFLATCERSFGTEEFRRLSEEVRAQHLCQHYAPIFGTATRALGIERSETQRLFLHLTLRGLLSAGVRLGILGPYRAQRLQFEAAPKLEEIALHCGSLTPAELAQTAPLLELFQSNHDRLYSRLFQS